MNASMGEGDNDDMIPKNYSSPLSSSIPPRYIKSIDPDVCTDTLPTSNESPMNRFPLRNINANTPTSSHSKSSHSRRRNSEVNYAVSIHNFDDTVHDRDDSNDVTDDFDGINTTSISIDIQDSIHNSAMGNSVNKQLDYDSVVYSGYAGSISAAPSDWSESMDMENSHDFSRSRPMVLEDEGVLFVSRDVDDSNLTHTDNSAKTSFSARMKKSRERRRRLRIQNEKAHKASLLIEFRAFLSRNKNRPPQKSDSHVDDMPGDVEMGDSLNRDLGTPSTKRFRDKNTSQDFSPHQIHGDVPWVVFKNDNDQDSDLSTLQGISRYGGSKTQTTESNFESHWKKMQHGSLYQPDPDQDEHEPQKDASRLKESCGNRDKKELFYLLLLVGSIITLTVLIAVVVVYS